MRFDLIRLVLNKAHNLFSMQMSREQWLRSALSEEVKFTHRKMAYHFVPEFSDTMRSSIIMGRVGRRKSVKEHEPPEERLKAVRRKTWTAALIYIDPRHHEDGQKVAFQSKDIGKPLSVMRSLANELNKRHGAPYIITANPIIKIESFTSFIEAHPKDITFIQFDLNAPNMFDDKSNVENEMRAARDKLKAEKARIALTSREGMTLKDPNIEKMADYTAKGGGQIVARSVKNDIFRSDQKVNTVKIDTMRLDDVIEALLLLKKIGEMLD